MCRISHTYLRLVAIFIGGWACAVTASSQCAVADDLQSPPAGLRVFYTGHSFHMFVPRRVEQLVESAGIKGHKLVGTQGIGGSRVYQHWDLAEDKNKAKRALASGKVDVFTMAAHLTVPDRGITNFTELGLKYNRKLRLLVQASWFPFDVPAPEKRIRDNAQRDDMKIDDLQAAIDDWRTKLEAHADELNKLHNRKAVFIVPVGDAVVKLRAMVVDGKYPGVKSQSELFTDPIGHGGPHVQVLAAYCNFAAIYGISPVGLKVRFPGVDDTQHAMLQELAWKTVSKYAHSGVADLASEQPVSRTLFGSCTKQEQPMPIFETIVKQPYPIYEVTASSFNQLHARGTPTKNKFRADQKTFHRENFGAINIDWERDDARVTLQVLDIDGAVKIEKVLTLSQLRAQLSASRTDM